ncbi:Ark- serine/threonine protein kinase [Microbotryomycetes sp. JL201]|nr:Ark- serine/threonine protein kinase [Microbotryomycetes sp. JL201]
MQGAPQASSAGTSASTSLLGAVLATDTVSKPNMHRRIENLALRLRRRQLIGSRQVALEVVKLLREIVSGAKFGSFKQLVQHLEQVGRILQESGPKEMVITNMTRRITMLISEEYATALSNFMSDSTSSGAHTPASIPATPAVGGDVAGSSFFSERDFVARGRPGALGSIFELLGHKSASSSSQAGGAAGSPFASGSGLSSPASSQPGSPASGHAPTIAQPRPNHPLRTPSLVSPQVQAVLEDEFSKKSFSLKPVFIEAIQELMDEVELTYQTIGQQAVDHIHSGEFILTIGHSKTVEAFLKAAARKRKFTVIVAETAPSFSGRQTAESLSSVGINTILIPDSNVFALLPRCSKVVLGPHLVLADGALLSIAGSLPLSVAANRMRVPVVVVGGMFKFSPLYLGEADWGMRDLGSPDMVLDSGEKCLQVSSHQEDDGDEDAVGQVDTEVLNPYYDVIPANLVDLYITNLYVTSDESLAGGLALGALSLGAPYFAPLHRRAPPAHLTPKTVKAPVLDFCLGRQPDSWCSSLNLVGFGGTKAMQALHPAAHAAQHIHGNQSQAQAAQSAASGTLPSGTIVRVGEYQVRVERFLSEGGFAHVYLATSSTAIPKGSPSATTKHVLKRIAVPDTKGVELKLLRNHPKIVNLIEASVSEMPGGVNGSKGYEIFILMEWCGGIIDMMNQRLQNRLTESEILKIFGDTVEAVAHMHYQDPPLIHRDLKVENILLTPPQTFKLCDFGSTTTPVRRDKVPTAVESLQKMEMEINRTTTLQYRAPELVDVWSRKGFDEKVDIWALGVLLYKLCYYTTPFEEHGPLAILNAQYKIPPYPAYSSSIKTMIAGMLQESASARPNIFQVHEQVCKLRGTATRLENKYLGTERSKSHAKNGSMYDSILSSGPAPSSVSAETNLAETISPMRRGRPSKATATDSASPAAAAAAPTLPAVSALKNVEPARLVKTGGDTMSGKEWEPMGAKSGQGQGVTSAWPTGKSAPEDAVIRPPSANTAVGFDDSFGGASMSSLSKSSPSFSAKASPTSGSGVAAFSDLLPPSLSGNGPRSSNTQGPMAPSAKRGSLTSTTTAKWSGPASKSPALPGSPLGRSSQPETGGDSAVMDERARFESQFPSLDDDMSDSLFATSSSFVKSPPTSVSTELTGDKTPELPRRPHKTTQAQSSFSSSSSSNTSALTKMFDSLSNPKPDLVSRSSQTSPRLLASWQISTSPSTMATSGLRQQASPPAMSHEEQRPRALSGLSDNKDVTQVSLPRSTVGGKRQQSVDLLGDIEDDVSPAVLGVDTAEPVTAQGAGRPETSSTSAADTSNGSGRVPTGDAEERRKFRPVRPTFASGQTATDDSRSAEERFPKLKDFDEAPAKPSDLSSRGVKESPARAEASTRESSDDDEVEDFAPRQRPEQKAAALHQTDNQGGGDIDLGPALASIRKFAPLSDLSPPQASTKPLPAPKSPPLLAPKPQSFKRPSQIDQLVSRFDTISPSTSTESIKNKASEPSVHLGLDKQQQQQQQQHSVARTGSPPAPAPPPASSKPMHLRTKPRPQFGSSASASSSSRVNGGAGTTVQMHRPPPFKPVAPSTMTGSNPNSPLRASNSTTSFGSPSSGKDVKRPAFGGGHLSSSSSARTGQEENPTVRNPEREQEDGEEGEERFKGVGNMKQKWEALSSSSSLSKNASTSTKVRKEWAAI